MIMESATKFVLVGLLNVVIFTLKMCSCQDYVCDIFEAKADADVRGLLECYQSTAVYKFTLSSSLFSELDIKLNCSSTDSEEIHSIVIIDGAREGAINYSSLDPPLTTNELLGGTMCQVYGCIDADSSLYYKVEGENCTIPLTGVFREGFRVIRSEDESSLKLLSYPERLSIAAKSGESHIVRLTEISQSAVTQENVNLSVDCLPWLNKFPEGSIHWNFIQLYDLGNTEFKYGTMTPLYPNTDVPHQRFVNGGDSNRWLNITETVVSNETGDPDSKIFMCKVCTNHGNVPETCHTSNFTLYVLDIQQVIIQSSLTSKPSYQEDTVVVVVLSSLITSMLCIIVCTFAGIWIGIKGCTSRHYEQMRHHCMKENDYEIFDANSELVRVGTDHPNASNKRCTSLSSLDTIQPLCEHLDIVDSDSDERYRSQDYDSQNYIIGSRYFADNKCEDRSAIHFQGVRSSA